MKTYTFRVVVEPDEDRWFACCPALEGLTFTHIFSIIVVRR